MPTRSLFTAAVAGFLLVCPAPAQRQFDEVLVKQHLPRVADDSYAVAVGDVDGDQDLDVVFAGGWLNGEQNRIHLNDGTGFFQDATASGFPVDAEDTRAVVLADFDGDTDLDVVFGNATTTPSGTTRMYLNDGAGTYSDASFQVPPHVDDTQAIAAGDVDGDGDLDLVIANAKTSFPAVPERLYLNNGAGVFEDVTAAQMPAGLLGTDTWAVALGDVDADNDLDIVFGNSGQNRLFLNDGNGTFIDATGQLPVDADDTHAVILGDVDGDTHLDLVTGNGDFFGGQNRLYLNDGSGNFSDVTAARMPAIADDTSAAAFLDSDGDGDLDLVFGNLYALLVGYQNRLYENDGTGFFTDVSAARLPTDTELTRALAVGDGDGDGDADIFLTSSGAFVGAQNALYLNDGGGTYHSGSQWALPAAQGTSQDVAFVDTDADGDLDVLLANAQQNALFENDGSGVFTDVTFSRLPADTDQTEELALLDADGDGDVDVAWGNFRDQNRLYINDGSGTFADETAARFPVDGAQTNAVASADVDDDGDADLVFGNVTQNVLYLNDGSGVFTNATAGRLPTANDHTKDLLFGDADGDGDPDLFVANVGLSDNKLLLNDGTGVFTQSAQFPATANFTEGMALGDVDSDGDCDVLLAVPLGPSGEQINKLYLNEGAGVFNDVTASRLPQVASRGNAARFADMDGDGDLDAVVVGQGLEYLFLNDGQGFFSDATARMPPTAEVTDGVSIGDADGDGDLDIVVANWGANRLFVNHERQLRAPLYPTSSRPYDLELYAQPGYATSSHTGAALLGVGLAPSPVFLNPLGNLFLDPTVLLATPVFAIPQATGRGVVQLTIPASPVYIGLRLYAQGVVIPAGVPGGVRLTNYTGDVVL